MTVFVAFNPAAFIVSPDSKPQSEQSGKRGPTHEINNPICNAKGTSRLHTPTNILDLRPPFFNPHLPLQPLKIRSRQTRKTRHDPLPNQLFCIPNRPRLGNLHLQRTFPESEFEDLVDFAGLVVVGFEFGDLVLASDAEVDVALCDESGDVGGREENEG
jgi:hypothetical protein